MAHKEGTSKWLEDWVWRYTADPKKKLANGLILGGGVGAAAALVVVLGIWFWTRNIEVQEVFSSDDEGEAARLVI